MIGRLLYALTVNYVRHVLEFNRFNLCSSWSGNMVETMRDENDPVPHL